MAQQDLTPKAINMLSGIRSTGGAYDIRKAFGDATLAGESSTLYLIALRNHRRQKSTLASVDTVTGFTPCRKHDSGPNKKG